jgi:hypothetical protein
MEGRPLKNACHRILIKVKDPRASSDPVALGESFQHTIDGLVIGVKASEDARVATTEALVALQTTVEWSAMRSVILH